MTTSRPAAVAGVSPKRFVIGTLIVVAAAFPLVATLLLLEASVIRALSDPAARLVVRTLQALAALALTLLGTAAYLSWCAWPRLASSSVEPGSGSESLPASPPADAAGPAFRRMLARVEGQAQEIGALAARLEDAYQDLEITTSRLKQLSFKDEVTGLYNRRFFSLRLEEEISRYRRFSRPVSVVMLDLDGFKAVNDRLGHPAGDEALRHLAQILTRQSRGINVIARFGGDEFAVLLVETPKAGAQLYADRIRQVVAGHPFGHGVHVTASFGVSSLPEDGVDSPEELVRAADAALYAAKRGGRNRVVGYEAESVTWPLKPR